MAQRIQQRRDIAANWTSVNPVLATGEIGFEIDTYRIKIGDGSTPWNSLDYYISDVAISANGGNHTGSNFVFSNSNNVSFGMNNGTITATASFSGSNYVFSNSNGITFGTNGSIVTASFSSPPSATSLVYSNSNNVTFGTNGSTLTASASFNQTVQTQGSVLINGSSGSIVFSNSNGITFGANASIITASYTVPTVTNSSLTISAGTRSETASNMVFSNANGVSFGLTGNTVTATVATNYLTTQTNFVLSNSNNVSFGTNESTVTATATFSQSNQSVGLYAVGNSTENSSTTLDARTISLNAIGGISAGYSNGSVQLSAPSTSSLSGTGAVSISVNGSTISIGAPTQTVQSIGLYASSQTTGQSSSSTQDARSLTVRGAGIVSVGMSAGELIISATGGGGGGLSAINISACTTSNNLSNFVLSNANGVTFGLDGSTVTGSVNTSYAASNHSHGNPTLALTNISGTTASASNGLTLSLSVGNYLTTAAQSTQTLAFSLGGNTATTNSSIAANGGYVLAGGNGVTMQQSNNTISISVATNYQSQGAYLTTAAQSTQTLAFSLGGNSATTNSSVIQNGGFILAGGNGVTVQQSNNTVSLSVATNYQSQGAYLTTAAASNHSHGNPTLALTNLTGTTASASNGFTLSLSAAAAGAAAQNINLLGANTAGNTTATGSTIGLSGINLTLSGTNNSIVNISAPATSSLSGTGQVSISVNGSTISIGVPNAGTRSGHSPYADSPYMVTQIGQGSLIIDPEYLPNLQFDRVIHMLHNTNNTNSSGSHTLSFWMGIYTRNASTLSLLASASNSTAVTHSGTAGSYASYSGIRMFSLGFTTTLSDGQYWMAFLSSSASGGANGSYSNMVVSNNSSSTFNFVGSFGAATNATMQRTLGNGYYSAATNGIPASIAFSQINGTGSAQYRFPLVHLASSTV